MKAQTKTIALSDIADEVNLEDYKVTSLAPGDEPELIFLSPKSAGGFEILDGFHRTAGYLKWAQENDKDPSEIKIAAIIVSDQSLAGDIANAEDPSKQRAAMKEAWDAGRFWNRLRYRRKPGWLRPRGTGVASIPR